MSKSAVRISVLVLLVSVLSVPASLSVSASTLSFSRNLSAEQKTCLEELLHDTWTPQFHKKMMSIVQVSTTILNESGRLDYVYLFEDVGWCGTAGCPLLIGELQPNGNCRLLYDNAADGLFVLRRRDHGYRRIWTPCEARFDGHQYQQLHEECPRPGVPR